MHYYIVFQNKAYEVGRLKSRHEEVSEGDMIFRYEGGAIVAVGIIVSKAYPECTLKELEVKEHRLQNKLRVKEVFKEMRQLMNKEQSPFAKKRFKEEELHRLSEVCGQFILDKIRVQNQF